MSFPALYLAVQAAYAWEPIEDNEFGITWSDIGEGPPMDVTWVTYRSEGAGLVTGVLRVDAPTLNQVMGQ
ncbi:MAG: hypothetical protein LC798_20205 [Chloroflexi bacterium]|nr:hypothetical protein [Chloroflexota bacterium]